MCVMNIADPRCIATTIDSGIGTYNYPSSIDKVKNVDKVNQVKEQRLCNILPKYKWLPIIHLFQAKARRICSKDLGSRL